MKMPNGYCDLEGIELSDFLIKSLVLSREKVLVELSSIDEWHDEVKSELILEQIIHSTEERVSNFKQNVSLQFCGFNLLCLNQDVLSNGFYSVQVLILFKPREIHLPKSTFS
jgi:hypothetical protein